MSAGSIKIGARADAPRAPRRVGPNPAAPRNPAQTLSSRDSPIRRFRQPSDPSPRQLRTRGLPRGDIGPGTPDRDVRDRGNVGAGTKPVGAAAPSRSRARSGIVGGLEWEHRRSADVERNAIMDRDRCADRARVSQASPAGPGSGASIRDGSLEAHGRHCEMNSGVRPLVRVHRPTWTDIGDSPLRRSYRSPYERRRAICWSTSTSMSSLRAR